MIPTSFIHDIPKAELHAHIDGCLRYSTIISLAKKAGVPVPADTPEELAKILCKEKYENLVDMLKAFGLVLAITKTPEALEQMAYEFAQDYISEGVCYLESRFAPQQHVGEAVKTIEEAFVAVNKGLKKAADEHNAKPEVVSKAKPEFRYGIISCIMRTIGKASSPYFSHLIDSFQYSGDSAAKQHAAIELVHASIQARDLYGIPVVAMDVAGGEKDNPCEIYKEAIDLARQNFLNVTIHAGEADGPESIWQAITTLSSQRIGHGLHLYDTYMSRHKDPEKFCSDVKNYLAKKGVAIEVCLTSNYQTCKELKKYSDHPAKRMIEEGLPVCFCCDNKFTTQTTANKELEIAVNDLGINKATLKKVVLEPFERSFFYGTYAEKKDYAERVKKYYEHIEERYHGLTN